MVGVDRASLAEATTGIGLVELGEQRRQLIMAGDIEQWITQMRVSCVHG